MAFTKYLQYFRASAEEDVLNVGFMANRVKLFELVGKLGAMYTNLDEISMMKFSFGHKQ